MLLDARAFAPPPRCGGGADAISQEAVDDAGHEIREVLGIARNREDLLPVRVIRDEGIDARIGVDEAGNDPEPKLARRERVEHLRDGAERVAAAGAARQDQHVGFGPVGF
jgi:hypothetical protein